MDDCSVSWDNVLNSESSSFNRNYNRKRDFWLTYVLVCMFGIGSWIAINGIWVEVPVLVNHAPEGYKLPSYLTVVAQLANLGPIIFTLGRKISPMVIHEKPAIYVIIMLGTGACVALCIFWNRKSYALGEERSTALIVLSFIVALVDCTSTVTFLPFMALFPPEFMSALYTGESMSGLLPGLVALAQGVDTKSNSSSQSRPYRGMNFSPEWFFGFLCFMMVVCGIAFVLLNNLPLAKRQHVAKYTDLIQSRGAEENHRRTFSVDSDFGSDIMGFFNDDGYRRILDPETETFVGGTNLTMKHIISLLIVQAWINAVSNGIISQVQSYACGPYGSVVYHLAVTLSAVASALTCLVFLWIPTKSMLMIIVWAVIYSITALYILVLAVQSPHPILLHEKIGYILVVVVSILGGISVSYTKLSICAIMRVAGRKYLFWCGVAIQLGSFIGAIVTFPVVNYAGIFHDK